MNSPLYEQIQNIPRNEKGKQNANLECSHQRLVDCQQKPKKQKKRISKENKGRSSKPKQECELKNPKPKRMKIEKAATTQRLKNSQLKPTSIHQSLELIDRFLRHRSHNFLFLRRPNKEMQTAPRN